MFHVTEHGESVCFLAEENLEMLQTAARLRNYIRRTPEDAPTQFLGKFSRGERISAEQFDTYVQERLDNTGRVTGVFDIDLGNGTFDALHIMDGLQRFRIQDISTAAYYATKKSYASQEHQWKVFLDRLDGKQLTAETETPLLSGQRNLSSRDIYFSDEIMQNDHLLELYMDGSFDVDTVFGTQVCTSENDDFLNIYANYDLERGCVCDTLEVYLVRGDGTEQGHKYRLSEEEQALLLPRMEEYCQRQSAAALMSCEVSTSPSRTAASRARRCEWDANPPCQPRVRPVRRTCAMGRGNTRQHLNRHGIPALRKHCARTRKSRRKNAALRAAFCSLLPAVRAVSGHRAGHSLHP